MQNESDPYQYNFPEEQKMYYSKEERFENPPHQEEINQYHQQQQKKAQNLDQQQQQQSSDMVQQLTNSEMRQTIIQKYTVQEKTNYNEQLYSSIIKSTSPQHQKSKQEFPEEEAFFPKDFAKTFEQNFKKNPQFISVSEIKPIREIKKVYSEQKYRNQLEQLECECPLYRQIGGDGNCFYRAAIFFFLENLLVDFQYAEGYIHSLVQQLLKNIISLQVCNPDYVYDCFIDYYPEANLYLAYGLDLILQTIRKNKYEKNKPQIAEVVKKIMNHYPAFDFACVLYARQLAYEAYKEYEPFLKDFYLGNEQELISRFDQQAQNCIIRLLSEKMKAKFIVKGVDEKQQFDTTFTPVLCDYDKFAKRDIYFFYVPGHYNLCYSLDLALDVYDYYNSQYIDKQYQQETQKIYSQDVKGRQNYFSEKDGKNSNNNNKNNTAAKVNKNKNSEKNKESWWKKYIVDPVADFFKDNYTILEQQSDMIIVTVNKVLQCFVCKTKISKQSAAVIYDHCDKHVYCLQCVNQGINDQYKCGCNQNATFFA